MSYRRVQTQAVPEFGTARPWLWETGFSARWCAVSPPRPPGWRGGAAAAPPPPRIILLLLQRCARSARRMFRAHPPAVSSHATPQVKAYSYRQPAVSSPFSGECSTSACDAAGYRFANYASGAVTALVSNSPACSSYLYTTYNLSTTGTRATAGMYLSTVVSPTPGGGGASRAAAAAIVYDTLTGSAGSVAPDNNSVYLGVTVVEAGGISTEIASAADIGGSLSAAAVPPTADNASCRVVFSVGLSTAPPMPPPPPAASRSAGATSARLALIRRPRRLQLLSSCIVLATALLLLLPLAASEVLMA